MIVVRGDHSRRRWPCESPAHDKDDHAAMSRLRDEWTGEREPSGPGQRGTVEPKSIAVPNRTR